MRCVACDKPLTVAESRWIPERGTHEDMCRRCRALSGEPLELPTDQELCQLDDNDEVPE